MPPYNVEDSHFYSEENVAKRYVSRPVVIEALRYDGTRGSGGDVVEWVTQSVPPGSIGISVLDIDALYIETLEGRMKVSPGDWIIRGTRGEFYPCKPDVFEVKYAAVEE